MLLKLLKYRLNVKYRPGNQMHIADTLSRAYVSNGTEIEESDLYLVFGVMTYYPASNSKIDSYKQATLQDETSQIVKRYIQKGWPHGGLNTWVTPVFHKMEVNFTRS